MTLPVDLARLLSEFPNGSVTVFDRDLRYVYAAGRGLDEVGLEPARLIGCTLDAIFPPEAVAIVAPLYRRAFQGETVVGRLAFFHRTYSMSAAPFVADGKTVLQIIVVAQDITALLPGSVMEPDEGTRTPDVSERRDLLIAALNHELRSPLGAMKMAAGLIRDSVRRADRDRARDVIERQIRTIENLAEALSDLERAPRGVLSLQFEVVDVAHLVGDAVDALRHHPAIQDRQIRVSVEPGKLHVRVDRSRIAQVISNLLGNAIRYTPKGGTISIGCTRGADAVQISVADTGVGIEPSELQAIFEPFRRGATGKQFAGSGLGLWVAREIALLHGGEIEAASAGPGTGSTFTVNLPLALLATEN